MFGDPADTGKPAGDDLVEGKRTVLVALALDAAPAEDAALPRPGAGHPLAEDEVERLRAIIDRPGAQAQVEEVITALTDRATGRRWSAAGLDVGARAALTRAGRRRHAARGLSGPAAAAQGADALVRRARGVARPVPLPAGTRDEQLARPGRTYSV